MDIFFNKLKKIVILNILIAISLPIILNSQSRIELDSIVKAKAANYIKSDVSAQGKLNISTDFNTDFTNKDIFFNYRIQSNLQANIYGVTVPLSFSFSNGRTTYGYGLTPVQLPSFNRIGLSPKYKDMTLHIGFRQLQYTKYTLNNTQFKGIGLEYNPKGYYFSLMKGTLKPAIAEDNLDVSLLEPSFKRNSWALKTGIQNENLTLGLAFISIKDDPKSLLNYEKFRRTIQPRENAVIGVYLNKKLYENLELDFAYAFSGLSSDIVNDPFNDIGTQYTAYNYFGLFTTRNNSIYDKAYNSSLSYNYNEYSLSLKMERVDPNFRSMGSFFFMNNFITRTGSINGQLLENKLNFNVEIGTENKAELNLNEKDISRLIGASGVKYKFNDRLSMNAKYSNMNNSSYVRKPSLQSNLIDSILQTQTKEKINLGSNYIFGKEKNKSLSVFLGYQRGLIVDQDQQLTARNSDIKNAGITYSISSEKHSNSFSYNIASIVDFANTIRSNSLTHTFSKILTEDSNFFSNTSLSLMNSEQSNNIMLQSEIGYDKNYFKLHKIRSSVGTQLGSNATEDSKNQIFTIILKITYDIAFNYRK